MGIVRWLGRAFGSRKGKARRTNRGQTVRNLRLVLRFDSDANTDTKPTNRNIDRILSTTTPSTNGMLTYKEHGLLLCEVHILRQKALQVLPREIYMDFLEELNDLVNLRTGIERQLRVVDRIRWAYGRWLSQ